MHIHILGICGTFMGGLAALAREAGHRVTGCDAGVYPPMSDQLRALGIDLVEGFGADQLAFKPDVFVVGNVVSRARLPSGEPKFPLMEAILSAGLPYTSGPQWLCEQVLHHPQRPRHVLAVAGTHGKTTTTSMLAWILEHAGLQPGFLVGGVPLNFGLSARLGQGAAFVIEADEYDTAFFDKRSKFVHYRPRTAVLNNLEFDHADIFGSLADIERQFHHLVRTVPSGGDGAAHALPAGRVVVNGVEESLQRVLAMGCWSEVRSFGATVSDFSALGEPHDFALLQGGKPVGHVAWALSGLHNQMNALAAIAAAEHLGVAPADAARALASFENVKRRMEVVGQVARPGAASITVYDDFAHHPTAMRLTLDGLRRRLTANAQPPALTPATTPASMQAPAPATMPASMQATMQASIPATMQAPAPVGGRILAVFEPRSNTMKLGAMKAQLPWSLESADLAFCHSGGLDWDASAALAPLGTRARVAPTIADLLTQVTQAAQPGDHIVCMSNGGFGGIHVKLMAALGG